MNLVVFLTLVDYKEKEDHGSLVTLLPFQSSKRLLMVSASIRNMLSRLWVKLVPYSISFVSHRELETGNRKLYLTSGKYFHFLSHIKPAESYFQLARLHSHSAQSLWVEEGKERGR